MNFEELLKPLPEDSDLFVSVIDQAISLQCGPRDDPEQFVGTFALKYNMNPDLVYREIMDSFGLARRNDSIAPPTELLTKRDLLSLKTSWLNSSTNDPNFPIAGITIHYGNNSMVTLADYPLSDEIGICSYPFETKKSAPVNRLKRTEPFDYKRIEITQHLFDDDANVTHSMYLGVPYEVFFAP